MVTRLLYNDCTLDCVLCYFTTFAINELGPHLFASLVLFRNTVFIYSRSCSLTLVNAVLNFATSCHFSRCSSMWSSSLYPHVPTSHANVICTIRQRSDKTIATSTGSSIGESPTLRYVRRLYTPPLGRVGDRPSQTRESKTMPRLLSKQQFSKMEISPLNVTRERPPQPVAPVKLRSVIAGQYPESILTSLSSSENGTPTARISLWRSLNFDRGWMSTNVRVWGGSSHSRSPPWTSTQTSRAPSSPARSICERTSRTSSTVEWVAEIMQIGGKCGMYGSKSATSPNQSTEVMARHLRPLDLRGSPVC